MLLFKLDFHFSSEWNSGTAARKRDLPRTFPRKLAVLTVPDCDGARLTVPTLSPMTGRHMHEVEHLMMMFRIPWASCRSLICVSMVPA